MNKIQHTRVADAALDRELRSIVDAINMLIDKVGEAGSSFPSDSSNASVQAVTVKGNLYSVAIKTKDGMVYSLPGLFVKTSSIPSVANENQILSAGKDGVFSPKDP